MIFCCRQSDVDYAKDSHPHKTFCVSGGRRKPWIINQDLAKKACGFIKSDRVCNEYF